MKVTDYCKSSLVSDVSTAFSFEILESGTKKESIYALESTVIGSEEITYARKSEAVCL